MNLRRVTSNENIEKAQETCLDAKTCGRLNWSSSSPQAGCEQTSPSTALLTERPRSFALRISDQTTDSLARAVATLSATHLITHNVWRCPQNLLVLSDTVSAMGLAREAGHVLLNHNRLPRACIIVRNTADAEDGWG